MPTTPITLDDVRRAGEIVYLAVRPTALLRHPLLDAGGIQKKYGDAPDDDRERS